MIRRRYADGRWGQLHLRENTAGVGVPLVCLHATAYSSRTFTGLLEALNGRRPALAIDTPGYGESDPSPAVVSIEDYAEAMAGVLPEQADILGYHTGVAIAVELALRYPAQVRSLVLMGVPHFRALDFEHWRKTLAAPHTLGAELAQFDERWAFLVANRPAGVSLAQGFANFVDELKAWPNGSRAHQALFDYDLPDRLAQVTQRVTILNPPGHLAEPSRLAAGLLAQAEVIELSDVGPAPLLTDARRIADLLA